MARSKVNLKSSEPVEEKPLQGETPANVEETISEPVRETVSENIPETKPGEFYKVVSGTHTEGDVTYSAGMVFEAFRDLSIIFPGRIIRAK